MSTPDFFFFYSKRLPKLLQQLDITIAYSTYQAGKLVFISSPNGENLVKYAKNFPRPMGIAYDEQRSKLALASRTSIDLFSSNIQLSLSYPERPKTYDKLFIPQLKYYTGYLDTHEIEFGSDQLWVTNTMFSSICTMSEDRHFKVHWKPDFISDLQPEDRCHLNGLALADGMPAYVTMFDQTDEPFGWKKTGINTGMIMDVRTNEVICKDLPMPHSPVLHEGEIYFLLSATGEVMSVNLDSKKVRKICEIKSFLRGMTVIGDYLIIGASRLREESTTFSNLPISSQETFCGIYIIDRHTGKNLCGLTYTDRIKEIFSVKIFRNVKSPAILTENDQLYDKSIMADEKLNFWVKKVEKNSVS